MNEQQLRQHTQNLMAQVMSLQAENEVLTQVIAERQTPTEPTAGTGVSSRLSPCETHIWDAMGRRCIRCAIQAPPEKIERNRVARDVRALLLTRDPRNTRALQNELTSLTEQALRELEALLRPIREPPVSQALDPPSGA